MFAMFVRMTVDPEHRDQLVEGLIGDGAGTLAQDRNAVRFDLYEDTDDPNTLYLHEAWPDDDALQSHLKQPYAASAVTLIGELREQGLLTSEPIVERVKPLFVARATAWDLKAAAMSVER